MRGRAGIAAALAALVVTGAAPAARLLPAERAALAAVHHGVTAGEIDRPTAVHARASIRRAANLIRRLPSDRRAPVAVALDQIGGFPGRLTGPRTVALIGQLKANSNYFTRHSPPAPKTDITDADGVVYRYFAGRCFEFHPLAEFVALNAHVFARDEAGTRRLANALIRRGVHQLGGVGWEYYFAFGGGHAPWLSGMAQAMAAQGFARAANLVPARAAIFRRAARDAYRPIPARLTMNIAAGPWIRLYAFDSMQVLNAQLQAVVSLRGYAAKVGDASAARFAKSMQRAAVALLPAFDTGYWTYYALPGRVSPLLYQDYVVALLRKLSPVDPLFRAAWIRFASYRRQPPAFRLAESGLNDVRFWLSKPATVTARSGAGPARRFFFGEGWHTIAWPERERGGVYPVAVSAVDPAGNRVSFQPLPIVKLAAGERGQTTRATVSADERRPALYVGAGLDDPIQAARAQRLGLRLVRVGVRWPTGSSVPALALAAAFRPLAGASVLVELSVRCLPVDRFETTALADYAAALAQQVPGIRYLALAPAPTAASAPAYAAALTAVREAVQRALPDVAVGPLVDGRGSPKATARALGRALAERADVVAFRPSRTAARGWTAADVPALVSVLGKSFGVPPPVLIDGLAAPKKAYPAAITGAACSSTVTGVILDRLFEGRRARAWARAVAAAAAPAQRGTVLCPGLTSRAAASAIEFPTELEVSRSAAVLLACVRDCLYLITLNDTRGRPVAARRGTLRGARRGPLTLELPKAKLDRARYRLDVRLVDRVNPGSVTRLTSKALRVNRT